ncbi:caffeic acid 3-O-methyltransferase 3 isoform X2 [Cryptomeria japonica]|uniref:caffeic acid 3-O-methyltransferase 3 isoform X2 n=1 Tax=Cryptomeria japonica TaxID=3369 RepID=UPI0027DA8F32|nr:caffeic acid 3-O-methyltransferase 3 isoform X2 [Cryptomeria japonica]
MEAEALENVAAHTQEAMETIFSFVPALVLKSALLLQIPDIIASEGPCASLSLHQIAARLPTQTPNLDYLFRILRYLSARGVFIQSQAGDDTSEVRFSLSECAKLMYVRENSHASLVPLAVMQTHEVMMAPWHRLHECVLQGGHAFEKAHGMDIFAYGKDHPEVDSIINDCMASFTMTTMKQIVSCYRGFEELGTVVDVGGGHGAALGVIVKAYPHIRGINFDLHHVVQTAPSIPGIENVGGNMFESIPYGDGIFLKDTNQSFSR